MVMLPDPKAGQTFQRVRRMPWGAHPQFSCKLPGFKCGYHHTKHRLFFALAVERRMAL